MTNMLSVSYEKSVTPEERIERLEEAVRYLARSADYHQWAWAAATELRRQNLHSLRDFWERVVRPTGDSPE